MFGSPCLMYHCWRDAERESRRRPPGDNKPSLLFIIVGLIFMGCLLKACFSAGGYGILIGIMAILGFIKGLSE